MGVDGIKTGYLAASKYSLAASIKRGERRLIGVGSGFLSKNSRSKQSSKLLTWGITTFDTFKISEKNNVFTELEVWHGKKDFVKVYTKEDIYKTIPKAKKKYMKVKLVYNGPIQAPIKKNDQVGNLKIYYKDEIIGDHNLYALEGVKKQNFISRIISSINFLIWGDV